MSTKVRKAPPEPTYHCSVCGWETKHEQFAYGRERIERDHEDVRDCLRHLQDRIWDLESDMRFHVLPEAP